MDDGGTGIVRYEHSPEYHAERPDLLFEEVTDNQVDPLLWETADMYPECSCIVCDDACECHNRNSELMLFECNSRCACGPQCTFRRSQQAAAHALRLQVFRTAKRGWGVRALSAIAKDELVCVYAGEILSVTESLRRLESDNTQSDTFLLLFQERFSSDTLQTCVDARYKGNVARFINHSCDPNLRVASVRERAIPRICLFARYDIAEGEELFFDYGAGSGSGTSEAAAASCNKSSESSPDAKSKRAKRMRSRVRCYCGASSCKQWMPRVSID